MTESSPMNPHKVKALELAVQLGGDDKTTVARAAAFHAFLTGGPSATPASPAAAGGGKPATPANPTAAGTTPKPSPKPAAAPKAADKAAAPKPAEKPAAKPTGTAAKPGAGAAASAQAPAGDTKAPGGKHTYDDVVKALCDVRAKSGKDDGDFQRGKVVVAALYDAVVEGCRNALEGEGEGTETAAADATTEDLTAGPQLDEFGMPVD